MASAVVRILTETNATNTTIEMIEKERAVGEASVMILGAVASIMMFFYLVNSTAAIRKEAWTMINLAVSIFLAVLSYNSVNHICSILFDFPMELDGGEPGGLDIFVKGLQLFCWWGLVTFLLFINRNSTLKLQSHGTIGGHILGFAAIYFFGYIASTAHFADVNAKWKMLGVVLLLWVALVSLFAVTGFIRKFIENAKCVEGEEIDRWHDQSKDTGTDFAAMGTAFLIVFWIRFLVLEELPDIDGELGAGHGNGMTLVGLGVLGLFLAAAVAIAHHHMKFGGFFDYISTTVSTTSAFLLIFALMWRLGHVASTELMSQTVVAVILTIMAVVFIFFVAFIKQFVDSPDEATAFNAIFTGVALAVGLSWEKVFDDAMDGFADFIGGEEAGESETKKNAYTVLLTWCFLTIVGPAWILYILPKASPEIQKEYSMCLKDGPLPLTALCSDEEYTNDFYGEEYDEENELDS